jgi:hypothetical protein
MDEMNRLGDLILKHWTTHRPGVIKELKRTHQLQAALRKAREQTGDLLYTLTIVHKMEYHAAWELATREWAFLPDEAHPRRPSSPTPIQTPSDPAISE